MQTEIRAIFDGTDAAELAAIRVGNAGVEILERRLERVFICDNEARFGLTHGVDLPIGSFKTLFSPDGRFSPQPLDAGGSVALTLVVDERDGAETARALRNRGGHGLTTM
ncbi:MAG: hypothetical protein IKU55_03650 [Clostridia bacterium]|nr:hypothetical protein [Clostridia bacterium]